MSDVQGLPGKGPNSAQYPNAVDNRTIFGSGTENTPLSTRNGQSVIGNGNASSSGGGVPFIPNLVEPIVGDDLVLVTSAAYPIGTPVIVSAYDAPSNTTTLSQALADDEANAGVVGLLSAPSTVGGVAPDLIDRGPVQLSAAQWDAIVQGEAGGLTPAATYYLNTVAGQKPITAVAPPVAPGNQLVTIGTAFSPTVMRLAISAPFSTNTP